MLSHVQRDTPEAGTRFDQDGGLNILTHRGLLRLSRRRQLGYPESLLVLGALPGPWSDDGAGKVSITSGWEITIIAALQTGTPFWVYTTAPFSAGGDFNADGTNWDVPDTPTDNSKFTGSHSRSTYVDGLFTKADFPSPRPAQREMLKRNSYRNPGMIQFDASLLKNNPIGWIGDKGNLQLRFDFLNVLNHVNLGSVDANMSDSTFGKVTSALGSRQLQLGVRVAF